MEREIIWYFTKSPAGGGGGGESAAMNCMHICLVVIHYIIHVYVISNVRLLHWNLKRIFRWDAVCCFMMENIE